MCDHPPPAKISPRDPARETPLFSLCIPAFEDAAAVERALACLRRQSVTDWECLVSDDSRSDAVAEVVRACADPRIRYEKNTPALGVPANWNQALAQARGEYVSLLHQDDFYQQETVLEQVAGLFVRERCDVVVCACRRWQEGRECGRHTGGARHLRHFLRDFPGRSLVVNRIGHPSVLFLRREKGIPLFDASLRYFLDTDWYARILKQGGRACFLSSAFVDVESGRQHQLSASCTQALERTAAELRHALERNGATAAQTAQAYARFYASHARHWRSGCSAALGRTLRAFGWAQRGVFCLYFTACLVHMGYRGLRKFLGFCAWR